MKYLILLCCQIFIMCGLSAEYDFPSDFEGTNSTPDESRRTKRDVSKIDLMASIAGANCLRGECNFGNMVVDAMVYFARWSMKLGKVPIGLYYDRKENNIKLSVGTYHVDHFLKEFNGLDDELFKCEQEGTAIEDLVMNFQGEGNSMKMIHMSNLHVMMTEDKKDRYLTVRCQTCEKCKYESLEKKKKYLLVVSRLAAEKLNCLESGFGKKVNDAFKFYATAKKRLLPAVDSRYWTLSKEDLKKMKSENESSSAFRIVLLKATFLLSFLAVMIGN